MQRRTLSRWEVGAGGHEHQVSTRPAKGGGELAEVSGLHRNECSPRQSPNGRQTTQAAAVSAVTHNTHARAQTPVRRRRQRGPRTCRVEAAGSRPAVAVGRCCCLRRLGRCCCCRRVVGRLLEGRQVVDIGVEEGGGVVGREAERTEGLAVLLPAGDTARRTEGARKEAVEQGGSGVEGLAVLLPAWTQHKGQREQGRKWSSKAGAG